MRTPWDTVTGGYRSDRGFGVDLERISLDFRLIELVYTIH